MTNVKVIKSDPPETKEILASAIVKLGEALDTLEAANLNERAVIVLLHDATKVNKTDIVTILRAIPRLKSWYCR
jgi:hypothetical protein